jgi:hypothetical protein
MKLVTNLFRSSSSSKKKEGKRKIGKTGSGANNTSAWFGSNTSSDEASTPRTVKREELEVAASEDELAEMLAEAGLKEAFAVFDDRCSVDDCRRMIRDVFVCFIEFTRMMMH